MRAHSIVHIDAGALVPAELLRCDHLDGRASFRLVGSDQMTVWLTGTGAELAAFADTIVLLAARTRISELDRIIEETVS